MFNSEDQAGAASGVSVETYEQWKERTGVTDEAERVFMERREARRAIEAARDERREGRLAIYELGEQEPRAWLDSEGRLHPEGPHPKIMFADVPVMLHLTNGYSLGPLSDEMGATEDGRRTAAHLFNG